MNRVGVVQMVSSSSVDENLITLSSALHAAKEAGVKLVLLPENFAFMGKQAVDKLAIAEVYGSGKIQKAVAELAKKYKIWIIAGTIFLKKEGSPKEGSRVKASTLVYDDAGSCVARYDKIHLFDVVVSSQERYQESETIEPGEKLVVIDSPVGRIGLTVCYDLRFPELYRQLTMQGAEIFAIPSAFTAITGAAHWEVLCRSRAIENLCYVLAANQGGIHADGRHTYGHSMIIEPWGQVVALQKQKTGLIVADIDLQHLRELRQKFPCNDHHVL